MAEQREFWIQTKDTTFLYYKVKARSKQGALEKFSAGQVVYVGCNDECNEPVVGVLEERPYIAWT